jgi:hypothetical protein
MANHIAINTTSASIPQQLQATQPPAPEQHSHHQRHAHTYSNNTFTASIHASNTSVIHITAMHPPLELHSHHQCYAATTSATQPPPVLRSHHQCYAVTTRVAQPPPVIPILSFLLSLWHLQYTTNSCHCNPTTSGAAQPPVISPLPFPLPPQMFPTHLTGHTPNRDLN